MTAENSPKKQRGKPFKPGQSGNPSGKPKGARNKTTLAIEALLDGEAEALTRKAIDLALDGDGPALRLCMERLCPPRKDRPISFELPELTNTSDAVAAMSGVLHAVAAGEVTPTEAQAVAAIVETYRRTVETAELERRISELEGSGT